MIISNYNSSLVLSIDHFTVSMINMLNELKVSKPKCVNPVLNNIGVKSLRFGGLQLSS